VRQAGDRISGRVTLFGVAPGDQRQLFVISDSTTERDLELEFPVAEEALRTRRTTTGTEPSRLGRVGEAARPLLDSGTLSRVVVFSDSLEDVQANVAYVRRQILIAGALALLVAVLAGFLVARALSARIRRLEQAARKVAGGDFSQPIPVDSTDELGRLAEAFNDMQRQLAQLDSARKRFIATASHELRTPIFSLGGFLELMADEKLDAETRRQFTEQLRGQVDRLRNLATELLDMSRLEAGSLELRPELCDLRRVARDVSAEFTPALARHRSALRLDLPPEPVQAVCDPDRVAQVLRILIDNALVHTPPETGVEVSAARHDGHVRLQVGDTGPGIKRADLPRVFEPFYTSDDAQGSGLGLAIAHELAGRMQGRLTVTSAAQGSRFALELPA